MEKLDVIAQKIENCTLCPRLVTYRQQVAREKVKRFRQEDYWGKPVPGWGDPNARIFVLGLAPAAHGANRTGRMFTGDSSGDWLYRALYETDLANQPTSTDRQDGLELNDVFISATIRCAPPQNKPLPEEIRHCQPYIHQELEWLKNIQVFIALGQIAFKTYVRIFQLKGLKFGHLQQYAINEHQHLLCSYHPSRQNTQTGKMLWQDWLEVFKQAKRMAYD
ncbi:MAG: uracil-DNA glycosylase [Candidatus Cyclobacteriaceae bacterium M3_2C_046]